MDIADYEFFQLDRDADPARFNHVWDPQTTWAPEPFELFRCCLARTLMSYNGRSLREGGAFLQPDLAADYPEISADGLTWTFHLKAGLFYAPPMADTPIVSSDIIRALERTLRPDPFAAEGDSHSFGPYAAYIGDVIAGADAFTNGDVEFDLRSRGTRRRDPGHPPGSAGRRPWRAPGLAGRGAFASRGG